MLRIRRTYTMNPTAGCKEAEGGVVVTGHTPTGAGKGAARTSGFESFVGSSSCSVTTEDTINESPSVDGVTETEPLPFCSFIVKFPKTAFGLTLSGHLFMLVVSLVLVGLGRDVFPAEFRQIPFHLTGADVTLKYWAWVSRNDPSHVLTRFTWNTRPWYRGTSGDPLQVMYSRPNRQNLFEKHILLQLQEFEDRMMKEGDYKKLLCQLDFDQTTCMTPNSLLRYFDGTFNGTSTVFDDPEFNNITGVVWEASHNPNTRSHFSYFLGNKTEITRDFVYTDYTRSEFFIGFPIENIQSWSSYVGGLLFHNVEGQMNALREEVAPDITAAPISWAMFVAGASIYGVHDVYLVVGSVIFIFLFMWFQMRSFFVTFWAVFSIVTSFFGTNLIYRYVLDFQYFGYFHLIAMFIILGIGADDIFVFFNTWKASAHENHRNNEVRLSDVYRRAAVSMFVTSFTTMVAFFVTSMTPLIAARSFGIFTGMLVIINYISVVVFFPTIVYLYNCYLEDKDTYLLCKKKIIKVCSKKNTNSQAVQPDAVVEEHYIHNEVKSKPSIVVRFFEGPYYWMITHPLFRWILLAGFLVVFSFFTWGASTLRADSEQVMIFKETTVLGRGWKLFFTAFQPNDNSLVTTNVVWGLRPRDDTRCHFSEYTCRGDASFDDNFDMNIPGVQLAMRDFCRRLKYNLTEEQLSALSIRRNSQGEAEVQCFMDNLERFLQDEEKKLNKKTCAKMPLDLSLPLTEIKVRRFMECQPCFYDMKKLTPSFYRYFEVMLSYWITNRYTMIPTHDFHTFNTLVAEAKDGENTNIIEVWNNNTAGCHDWIKHLPEKITKGLKVPESAKPYYGTRLKFAAIPVNLTMNFFGLGYATGLPVYDSWEKYLQKYIPQLPHQMHLAMQTNGGQWHWLFVQKTLVNSALVGVGLGIGLALPVLILATRNIIIGTLATVIITATCVCVVGVIPLPGWKLGMLVSINLCIVVGLSIDYIVHMAEAYHMSIHMGRMDRVRDMLGKTGISIVAGAATTLGASFFMFFGKTQFFLQFAAFMFSTISFSALFSMGLFPVVMALCGPVGEVGSIVPLWKAFKNCFTGRKTSDMSCDKCRGRGFLPTDHGQQVGVFPEHEHQEEFPSGLAMVETGAILDHTHTAAVAHYVSPCHVNPSFEPDNTVALPGLFPDPDPQPSLKDGASIRAHTLALSSEQVVGTLVELDQNPLVQLDVSTLGTLLESNHMPPALLQEQCLIDLTQQHVEPQQSPYYTQDETSMQ